MSDKLEIEFLDYYKNLIKNNEEKSVKEIVDELGVNIKTVYNFFQYAGISSECIGYEYNDLAKQILLHTNFTERSRYYKEKQKVIEELNKKQRNREIVMRLKEISDLKKARTQLVNVLSQVSMSKSSKTK